MMGNKIKLAISDIAWHRDQDEEIYEIMQELGFTGLEIAPTRFMDTKMPYEKEARDLAVKEAKRLRQRGLCICSMQSLWFGKTGRIAQSREKYEELLEYTKKAMDYASAIECPNLVFGNPAARRIEQEQEKEILLEFFEQAGEYAREKKVILAIEANPVIYNTNFLNKTEDSLEYIKKLSTSGCKVNLDLGTVIYNEETISDFEEEMSKIHHIHISEPGLEVIKERKLHRELKELLYKTGYENYLSVEMKTMDSVEQVRKVMEYVSGIFK